MTGLFLSGFCSRRREDVLSVAESESDLIRVLSVIVVEDSASEPLGLPAQSFAEFGRGVYESEASLSYLHEMIKQVRNVAKSRYRSRVGAVSRWPPPNRSPPGCLNQKQE
jgi:hypothetical protein